MKSNSSTTMLSRMIFLFWLAAPFVLIVLNYKEIWLWTPFGRIEPNSGLISDAFSSTSWLLVIYLGPFLLMHLFQSISPEKSEAIERKVPPIASEKFVGFLLGVFATVAAVMILAFVLMIGGYKIEKDPYHHHSNSGIDIG